MFKPKMKTTIILIAAAIAASSAAAQDGDTPRGDPMPVPCIQCNAPPSTAISSPVSTGVANASSIANPIITTPTSSLAQGGAGGNADASNTNTIGGDTSKSIVAVFPPPSTAVVPMAHNCIVTRSRAGGLFLNLVHGAASDQYSDPVCTLMALHARATSTAQAEILFTEILRRLAAGQ